MIECYSADDAGHVCILQADHEGTHRCCCLLEWAQYGESD